MRLSDRFPIQTIRRLIHLSHLFHTILKKSLTWSRPYAEAGIGLDNILGIGRIEYVWRLNYRSNVGARRGGIAIGIDMLF